MNGKIELTDLIGIPYKVHGRDKNGYDCYGLAIEVEKRYGVQMPDYIYKTLTKQTKSEVYNLAIKGISHIKLSQPKEGCLVVLNVLQEPFHIAVYIGKGKIIHSNIKMGVVIEKLSNWENKIQGYYQIT